MQWWIRLCVFEVCVCVCVCTCTLVASVPKSGIAGFKIRCICNTDECCLISFVISLFLCFYFQSPLHVLFFHEQFILSIFLLGCWFFKIHLYVRYIKEITHFNMNNYVFLIGYLFYNFVYGGFWSAESGYFYAIEFITLL